MDDIINKVANSGVVSLDLEEFYEPAERVLFDIKPLLYKELVLKEKDFREFIKTNDWTIYKNKIIGLVCTTDAIVPTWAYMLLTLALAPHAKKVFFGDLNDIEKLLFAEKLAQLDLEPYIGARVVIKGCGEKEIPHNAFVQITAILQPIAKSIMFGEPCSTVPLYKSKI
jgi:hypothetical protein